MATGKTPSLASKILERYSPLRHERPLTIASSVGINLLALAMPLLMLQVFDRVIARQSLDTLAILILGVALAVILESLLRIVRSHLSAWTAARFEHQAMCAATSRLLAMPLHQFERSGSGAHMDHFKAIQSLKHHFSGQTFQQVIDLPFSALYFAIILVISPWVALVLAAGYAVFALIARRMSRGHRELVKERTLADQRRGNFLVETLNNIHTLKSMSMEAVMLRRYERLQETCARAMERLTLALDLSGGAGTLFSPLVTMLVVATGAFLVVTHRMSTGELAACIFLGMRALAPLARIGTLWSKHAQEEYLAEDVAKLLAEPPLPTKAGERREGEGPAGLEIQDLHYRFPGAQADQIDGATLSIRPGECIAITGDPGSGRTTLLQLMIGALPPAKGVVLFDGADVRKLDPAFRSAALAYLPQKAQLFEGTLLDNVSVYESGRIDAGLEAAHRLRLGEFVSKLPRGWDSPVGDAAAEALPPGHRQRVGIVRAVSGEPRAILFDDATASVDGEGETAVREFLESAKGKVTLVLVTQRPSIQRLADRKVKLEKGRLVPDAGASPSPQLRAVPAATPAGAAATTTPAPTSPVAATKPDATDALLSPGHPPSGDELWARTAATVRDSFKKPTDHANVFPGLLKALGWRRSPREVAESLPYFAESLDVTGLLNTMAQLGFQTTEAPCVIGAIDPRAMPCLFVPPTGAAMVVVGRESDGVRVLDANGKPARAPSQAIEGRAFFFARSEPARFEEGPWVRRTLGRFRPLLLQAGVSSILFGLLMLASPLFVMAVYNEVIPSGALDTLVFLALGVTIGVAAGTVFIVHRARILAYIAGRIEYLFGATVLQQILRMSPAMTERAAVGAQVARLSSFEAIRELFTGTVASTMLESPATLAVLVALSIINPVALLVFALVVLVYGLMYLLLAGPTAKRVAALGRASTRRNEFLVEMMARMRAIRELGAERKWLERFQRLSAEASMASYRSEQMSALLVGLSYFVMMAAGLAIIGATVPLTFSQSLGAGALIASMMLMWRVLGPVQVAFTNLPRIERVKSAVRQLDALMRIKGEQIEATAPSVARGAQGAIEFGRVSFRYGLNVDPALVGVSFSVKPGELIAITGPNGGGKSTMLKLVLGMYQPQAGSIRIDGTDIRQIDPVELRRTMGYAPQDAQLFRATILQNLRLARPDATDREVLDALDMAGAREQVMALPKGLDFRVGDNASDQIPSSLRQKLSLARAYLTRAPILLFDEPGTGLDQHGDECFMRALARLRGKCTVLYITHRPSHMKLADMMMVFDGGYLRAAGKPDELMKQPGAAA